MISICDPISHGLTPTSARTRGKRKRVKVKQNTKFEQFCIDFASEIDFFDSNLGVPRWVFDYRDDLLRKISPELRRICYALKQLGLIFKIKWPVEIDGKWKFADVLFPRQRTVLTVVNPMELSGRPHWMLSNRGEFFKDRYRVVEVETLEELQMKMDAKRMA